ncbi:helix-turn-helix domain-containing transcriptional regulator [Aequorivita ciconiae]|uniref:helix-turn-helix domain-containing transcriptional regulator n=1 Tax=Aequorivita ciconiae TaxID=2494375 RepID=UPI001F0BC496|nr:hypothetical protein [Aequorivita sp. H23M31]
MGTSRFEIADYLDSKEMIAEYLNTVFEEGNKADIINAISNQIISENPEYGEKEFDGMFVIRDKERKTNWFKHYDALVFISDGEEAGLSHKVCK